MKNSLHIRFVAPLDWRIKTSCKSFNMAAEKAATFVQESDERRTKLIECFGEKNDTSLFDAIYNTSRLTHEEIVDQILILAKQKGFFK